MPRKMNCRDVGLRLQSFIDSELDLARMEGIRAHLAACLACGLDHEVYSRIKAELHRCRRVTDPSTLAQLEQFATHLMGEGEVS